VSAVFALLAVVLTLSAVPAYAATPTAFATGSPLVFLSQSDNSTETTLYQAVQTSGQLKFNNSGQGSIPYNAIGFDTIDGFLYGINSVATGAPQLVRVGQNGVSATVGTLTGTSLTSICTGPTGPGACNAGDFGTGAWADTYFFRSSAMLSSLYYVKNVSGGGMAAVTVSLTSPVPNTADIVFLNGYIWGFYGNTTSTATGGAGAGFYRITPNLASNNNWVVTYYPVNPTSLGMLLDNYGAQWAYGNGNIGVATNANGAGTTGNTKPVAYQIDLTNPSSPKIISSMPTTASSGNDAASYVGAPIDLAIEKTATPTYTKGGAISYTLTVTNMDGQYDSSGFVVTDTIPASVTNPKSTNTGVTFSGNNMTWVGDALPHGASASITITGTVSSTATEEITNSATVIGNEDDPNSVNNTSTAISTLYVPPASLTVTKTVTGQFSDMTKQFPFTITLKDAAGNPVTGTVSSTAGQLDLTDGAASFSLGNGDNIVFTVPVGDSAQIDETDNYGYRTTYTDSGNVGVTSTGAETDPLTITGDREVDFTNEAVYAPPTGVAIDDRGVLEMCGIVLLIALLGYCVRLVPLIRKGRG